MKLGTIIRMYMDEHNFSMREFAKICNLSPAQVSFMERGRNSNGDPFVPREETLIKLAAGMGITLGELLTALDEDTRVRLASAQGVTMSPEKQAVIDKILIATPEQFSLIQSYVDFVIKGYHVSHFI